MLQLWQGKKMTRLLHQGARTPTRGFWESDMVCNKRKSLLEKGAQQGWLMDTTELQMGEPIGQGSFGQTFEANWRGTRVRCCRSVSYTHLTLPTNREV